MPLLQRQDHGSETMNLTGQQLGDLARFAGVVRKRFLFPYAEVKAGPLKEPMICYAHKGKFVCQISAWSPATKPEHGDLVLRALRKHGAGVKILVFPEPVNSPICRCDFMYKDKVYAANWWPEAVCRTALELIRQNKQEGA